jgi:hypothetical protein
MEKEVNIQGIKILTSEHGFTRAYQIHQQQGQNLVIIAYFFIEEFENVHKKMTEITRIFWRESQYSKVNTAIKVEILKQIKSLRKHPEKEGNVFELVEYIARSIQEKLFIAKT